MKIHSVLLTLLMAVALSGLVRAGEIPLANPSFEDGDLCKVSGNPAEHPDEEESPPIPGWRRTWGGQQIQIGRGCGEDGGQILEMGDGATSLIFQRVGAAVTVQPDTTYRLTALVGAPQGQDWIGKGRTSEGKLGLRFTADPEAFSDYDSEFWSDPIVCSGDAMEEYSLSVSSSEHPEIVGRHITVFLATEGSDEWDNYQAWDRVRLTATPEAKPEAR